MLDATLQMIARTFSRRSSCIGTGDQRAMEMRLGDELAEQRGADQQRQRLLNGVIEGDPAACALVEICWSFAPWRRKKCPRS